MQLRPDLSQSTPNLLDKSVSVAPPLNGTSMKPATMSRHVYNRQAMAEISQSLAAVKNPHGITQNGYSNAAPDHSEYIQELIKIGYGEVSKTYW